jgi:hypothetical protein
MKKAFTPYFNTFEGLSLTPLQWKNLGVQAFAFKLEPLLQRPGYGAIFSLKSMVVIEAKIYLDLSDIDTVQSMIQYRRPDGCLCKIARQDLDTWLSSLDADEIIFDPVSAKALNFSNQAGEHAFQGCFYAQGQVFQVMDAAYIKDFSILSQDCDCESCQSGFTRAYLHHLYQHTPLLAQRYLLIHNARQCLLGL